MGPLGRSPVANTFAMIGTERERVPDRADHRRGRRAPDRVPADRAVDVPQPELPRRGRPGNLAHGGSLIFHSECQMRYITQIASDC